MTGKNCFFLSVMLLLFVASFGQPKSEEFFTNELKKTALAFQKERTFYKAYVFFKKKQWDSTLIYSGRQLKSGQAEVNDYCHFFRAISLREKKLLVQAGKEFLLIPKTFKFYSLVLTNLGEIALEQNHYREALRFFSLVEMQNDRYCYKGGSLYHNIGLCYFHLGQFDKAGQYLKKGLLIQEKQGDSTLLIGSYMDLANLNYEQYKDQEAIPYFEKAYRLSKKTSDFELKQNAALNMAVVEENRKNPIQALVYRKEYEIWKDSLNDQNKVWAIAETEKKYIISQTQKEITLLEAKNKIRETQRNGFFYSSLLLLALFGTGAYFYRQKIKANTIILSQKTALDELNAAKDRLFSIVSHDLRSSVSALKNSNDRLSENLGSKNYKALDELLHHNSRIANSTYTLLDNLLNWAMLQTRQSYFYQEQHSLYMIIEQASYSYKPLMANNGIRFENAVAHDVFVFVDLDAAKIIFRNLLDNGIKFSRTGNKISIYLLSFDDSQCKVVVEDTGKGMGQETLNNILKDSFTMAENKERTNAGTGLGMQLCKSLIEKNGGKLAVESSLNAGTKIIITLPIKSNDGQYQRTHHRG